MAITSQPPQVFISYQRADDAIARQVREHLAARGVQTWMDQFDIPVGAYWTDEVDKGLAASDIVVGVLSPDSVESRNVKNEWDWAIQHDKRLVLLQVRPCDIPHRYVSINFIDATGSDRTNALTALLATLGIEDEAADRAPVEGSRPGPPRRVRRAQRASQRRFPEELHLAGRDDATRRLGAALDAMLAERGQLILLGGEAGIGKTTLTTWLGWAAEERSALVLSGGCYDLATTPPYGPWLEIIRAWPEGEGAPALPDALRGGESLARLASQTALFELVAGFWIDASTWRPLVLVLEDLHWVDQATLELLRHLVRPIAGARIMLVATYRDDEITRKHPLFQLLPGLAREPNATRLLLPRLDDDGLRDLVAGRYPLSDEDSDWLVGYLQRQTEGNPFFSTEVLTALVEAGAIEQDGDAWRVQDRDRVQVPDLVRQVIEGRLTRLGDDVHRLLQVAAVIGHEVPVDLWIAVSGEGEELLSAVLDRATEAHIVEEVRGGDGFRFTHALIRETLYEGLSLLRRRAAHRRAGENLAAAVRPDPDVVAHHFQRAGDTRAGEWLVRAGERAARQYAWPMAADRLEAALALEEEPRVRGWILYRIGFLLRFTDRARAIRAYQDAVALVQEGKDPILLAYVTAELGRVRFFTNDVRGGVEQLIAGVEMILQLPRGHSRVGPGIAALIPVHQPVRHDHGESDDPEERIAASIENWRDVAALFLLLSGRVEESIAISEELLRWTDELAATRAWDWDIGGVPAGTLALGYAMTGRADETEPLFRRGWNASLQSGDLVNAALRMGEYLNHVVLWHSSTDLVERKTMAASVAAMFERAGAAMDPTATASATLNLLYWEGHWTALRGIGDQFVARLPERHNTWHMQAIGSLALHQGDAERVWTIVASVLPDGPATAPGNADVFDAIEVCAIAARQALATGDRDPARAWIDALARWVNWSTMTFYGPWPVLLDAQYARLIGDRAAAMRLAQQSLDLAASLPQPFSILAAQRLLGELATEMGNLTDAGQYLAESLALADACAAPFERALTLLALADLDALRGDMAAARHRVAEVRAICEPLEARPTLERVESLEERLADPGVASSR